MANERILDHDAATGITEIYHFDPVTHGFTIETRQDITNLLEVNKAMANEASGWKGDLHHIASIPLTVLMDLATQGICTPAGVILDDKKYRQWLNDPENRCFRTKLGRV